MVYVCRKERFSAAHRLFNPDWSEAQNQEVFGSCANQHGHGHDFNLIVKVKGTPHPDTGMVVDMKKLGDLIKQEVIQKLHHKYLNEDVAFLKNKMPTCEVLVIEIWRILAPQIRKLAPQAQLDSLQLYETEKNFVEYHGELA